MKPFPFFPPPGGQFFLQGFEQQNEQPIDQPQVKTGYSNDVHHTGIGIGLHQSLVKIILVADQQGFSQPLFSLTRNIFSQNIQYNFPCT